MLILFLDGITSSSKITKWEFYVSLNDVFRQTHLRYISRHAI